MIHGVVTCVAVIVCRAISWLLIINWQLPVHYLELQTEDKLKASSSWLDLAFFRLCSRDTHTYFDDIVTRVDTPVIPSPESSDNLRPSCEEKKGRPKSWWSAEERSATMELSYLTAVIDAKLVLLSNSHGSTIQQSSPISTPRGGGSTPRGVESAEEKESPPAGVSPGIGEGASHGQRDRSHARDWDAMPEAIKQSKGRFQLHGGKSFYTDSDLSKNLERHRALSRKTRGRGFSGWNRHTGAGGVGAGEQLNRETMTTFPPNQDQDNPSASPVSMEEKDQMERGEREQRRTALLDYHDFIPSSSSSTRKTEKLPLSPTLVSTSLPHPHMGSFRDVTELPRHEQQLRQQPQLEKMKSDLDFVVDEELERDEDMVWEVNPSRGD
jgi:hypothetical protein